MTVLHVSEHLSAKLKQRAARAGMSPEAYTHELLEQAVEEADDLDLALDEHRQGGRTYSSDEAGQELGLSR